LKLMDDQASLSDASEPAFAAGGKAELASMAPPSAEFTAVHTHIAECQGVPAPAPALSERGASSPAPTGQQEDAPQLTARTQGRLPRPEEDSRHADGHVNQDEGTSAEISIGCPPGTPERSASVEVEVTTWPLAGSDEAEAPVPVPAGPIKDGTAEDVASLVLPQPAHAAAVEPESHAVEPCTELCALAAGRSKRIPGGHPLNVSSLSLCTCTDRLFHCPDACSTMFS
jgi:hypothetical protein